MYGGYRPYILLVRVLPSLMWPCICSSSCNKFECVFKFHNLIYYVYVVREENLEAGLLPCDFFTLKYVYIFLNFVLVFINLLSVSGVYSYHMCYSWIHEYWFASGVTILLYKLVDKCWVSEQTRESKLPWLRCVSPVLHRRKKCFTPQKVQSSLGRSDHGALWPRAL